MINASDCCGCGACENICPKKAIEMITDVEGYRVPKVDLQKCVNCNFCDKACPRKNKPALLNFRQRVYAAYHKDVRVRCTSTSGGMFTALTDIVLEQGGVVVGVSMDADLKARFHIARTKQERDSFKKAKYVQADCGEIYAEVQVILKTGTLVLFAGVPCQVHALKCYLVKDYANLYCVDLLCYGITSAQLFQDYIQHQEKKVGKKIIRFSFRERDEFQGWHKACFCANYSDGTEEKYNSSRDYYYGLFFKHIAIRDSCYSCTYKKRERVGDITLGDFWKIEKIDPTWDSKDGISLLMVNTLLGSRLFEQVQSEIAFKEFPLSVVNYKSTSGNEPPYRFRKNFFWLYKRFGFSVTCFWHVTVRRVFDTLRRIF